MDYYVFTFKSIHEALAAEKLLADYNGTIIPVPAEISSDCGFALRLPELEPDVILNEKVKFSEIYRIQGRGKDKTIEIFG